MPLAGAPSRQRCGARATGYSAAYYSAAHCGRTPRGNAPASPALHARAQSCGVAADCGGTSRASIGRARRRCRTSRLRLIIHCGSGILRIAAAGGCVLRRWGGRPSRRNRRAARAAQLGESLRTFLQHFHVAAVQRACKKTRFGRARGGTVASLAERRGMGRAGGSSRSRGTWPPSSGTVTNAAPTGLAPTPIR